MTALVVISTIIISSYLPNHIIYRWRRHRDNSHSHPCRLLRYCCFLAMLRHVLCNKIISSFYPTTTQIIMEMKMEMTLCGWLLNFNCSPVALVILRDSYPTTPKEIVSQPRMNTNKVGQYYAFQRYLGRLMSEKETCNPYGELLNCQKGCIPETLHSLLPAEPILGGTPRLPVVHLLHGSSHGFNMILSPEMRY